MKKENIGRANRLVEKIDYLETFKLKISDLKEQSRYGPTYTIQFHEKLSYEVDKHSPGFLMILDILETTIENDLSICYKDLDVL